VVFKDGVVSSSKVKVKAISADIGFIDFMKIL